MGRVAYRTVQSDATAAREALLRLWSENLTVEGDLEAKLRWFYLDAPSGRGEAFLLQSPDDAVVGCAGLSARELSFRGGRVRAALLADFVIDKAHRSALPALTLQRAIKRHTEAAYDLSYGFPNSLAVAVLKRAGYHELGKMARYVRVLRHAPFVAKQYGRAAGAAAVTLDPALLAVTRMRGGRSWPLTRLTWLADFDARFDRLWERARPPELIACRRSAELLRWRFGRAPGRPHAIAALVDGNEIRAYVVVRGRRGGPAELVDLLGRDLEAVDSVFARIAPELYLRGHTTISFRYLGAPRLRAVLERHRFALRDEKRSVIVNVGASSSLAREVAYDPQRWYLTDLDEDT